jgi:DNA modification methylase
LPLTWDKVQRIDQADCEFAWTSFNGSARVFQYARGNESGFAPKLKGVERAGINIHPTQKPIALYTWVLSKFAKDGDLILDTHLGSGSSRIAARKGGFNFVGFEMKIIMKHKKSVLKILSANSECFRVSAGIAPNVWCFAKAGLRRTNVELTTKDN